MRTWHTFWACSGMASLLCGAHPAWAQVTERKPPAMMPSESPPAWNGPPPAMTERPDNTGASKGWCRSPSGNFAECKVVNNVIDDGVSYPPRAEDDEVEGEAIISCTVTDHEGRLACTPVAENPPHYDFAKYAARTASRESREVSPGGYDLTGYTRAIFVPFRFTPGLWYRWREFPNAEDLSALMLPEARQILPPLDDDGYEVPNANVTLSCLQMDQQFRAACNVAGYGVPDMVPAQAVADLVSRDGRLIVIGDKPVPVTVLFPIPQPKLSGALTTETIIATARAAKGHGPLFAEAPSYVRVTLRCQVTDAEGHLTCDVTGEDFPSYRYGEAIRALIEARGQVTLEPGWRLVGRTVKLSWEIPVP